MQQSAHLLVLLLSLAIGLGLDLEDGCRIPFRTLLTTRISNLGQGNKVSQLAELFHNRMAVFQWQHPKRYRTKDNKGSGEAARFWREPCGRPCYRPGKHWQNPWSREAYRNLCTSLGRMNYFPSFFWMCEVCYSPAEELQIAENPVWRVCLEGRHWTQVGSPRSKVTLSSSTQVRAPTGG